MLRGGLPGFRGVFRNYWIEESGGAEGDGGIRVIAAYGDELIFGGASDGEDSGGSVVGCDGNSGGGPRFASILCVEDAGSKASSDDVEFSFGDDEEIGIAGCECAFFGESGGEILRWKRIPAKAVAGVEDEEFSVDGIAEGKTHFFREASDGIEEERFIYVGVLLLPGGAAVGGFVDAGFVAFAAGHEIGGGVAEGDDAAKIEIGLAGDGEAGPGGAVIERAQDDAVRAGSPDGDVAGGRSLCGADATEIGDGAGGKRLPRLGVQCADTESETEKYENES